MYSLDWNMKNVRFAYIKVDENGATVDIPLDDEEFNYYPVTKATMIDTFTRLENEECGAGTNDVVDLCAGIDAALTQFETHALTESIEREKKIAIVSNNRQKGNLLCSDGQHICDKYQSITLRDEEGVSIVMINIDMDGNPNEYLPCLTYYDEKRILDATSLQLVEEEFRDNREWDGQIKLKLCEYIPTPGPTMSPTPPPSPSPTPDPTPGPTPNPSPSPTPDPTPTPTPSPTGVPTPTPTRSPTKDPTPSPSPSPTREPTDIPSYHPTTDPTPSPTGLPTPSPTPDPTPSPTDHPTPSPTGVPTPRPTPSPTPSPTDVPTDDPTPSPTPNPTCVPTKSPTPSPTYWPTPSPTKWPTPSPTYW